MISSNDFRNGLTIEVEGDVFQVIEFLHVKPGKGSAFVRTKLRNIRTGGVVERTFRAGEKVSRAMVERRQMQYLYRDGDSYVVMDVGNYEQLNISSAQLGDGSRYLKENMVIDVLLWQGQTIGLDIPKTVELTVVDTEPGIRGDTASGATKAASLETGVVVQVPLFVNVGDVIRVDTRSGAYLERA